MIKLYLYTIRINAYYILYLNINIPNFICQLYSYHIYQFLYLHQKNNDNEVYEIPFVEKGSSKICEQYACVMQTKIISCQQRKLKFCICINSSAIILPYVIPLRRQFERRSLICFFIVAAIDIFLLLQYSEPFKNHSRQQIYTKTWYHYYLPNLKRVKDDELAINTMICQKQELRLLFDTKSVVLQYGIWF